MIKVNGKALIDGRLTFPRVGVWHAEIRADSFEEIVGPATVDVDDGRLILTGTVARGGDWQDAQVLRVVGGANGLRRAARPKHYTATSVRIVLGDLLAGAGETLSATADASTLLRTLTAWTTMGMATGRLVQRLLETAAPRASWRMLPNGSVWVGAEPWPDSGFTEDDFQVLAEDPSRAEAMIGMEVPLLMPGTKLDGRRVSYVEHRIGPVESRTSVWFE